MKETKPRKIKQSSQEIIDALKAGSSQRQLILAGYSESTVVYYYRKLFYPRRFRRFIRSVENSQAKKKQAEKSRILKGF